MKKRYESDLKIPGLGTLVDVEMHSRYVLLFGVQTGNSHAIGLIEYEIPVDGEVARLHVESLEDAVFRVFGAVLKEVG